MVSKKVVIKNRAGIHCRPSSEIMAEADKFQNVTYNLIAENGTSSLQSILELLALGLQQGDEATLQVTGENEQEACDTIAEALEKIYDFPPQNN